MKRVLIFVFAIFQLSFVLANSQVTKEIVIEGIAYKVYGHYEGHIGGFVVESVSITKNDETPYSGSFIIPDSIYYSEKAKTFPVSGISYDAFENCINLTSVTIPKTVRGIGQNQKCLFDDCVNLVSITIDEQNEYLDSRNNCNAIISTKDNKLIATCSNSTIPNSITSIGKHAFCTNLTSLVIPNSVTFIDQYAFENCSGLTSIVIPNSVTDIGIGCFMNCSGLTSISFPIGLKKIDMSAFRDCVGLSEISIPESVEIISAWAFKGCTGLTDVYCHSKPQLETNGIAAFEDASNTILHVRDVDIEAFKEDRFAQLFFKEIVVDEKITDFNLTYYVDGEEYKTVQYKYDDKITSLEYPVKDGYTFSGWKDLPTNMPGKDVKVEGTFTSNEIKKGGVIYHVLNEQAAVIGNDNAAGEVKIAAFVTFNEKSVPVTDIVDFSFKGNTEITSVVIPESVRKIGDEAFYGCKNIAKIELGKSVNQIEPRAFAGIDKLEEVIVYAENVPDADRTAFENSYTEDYVTLHVPAGSLEKYKAAAPWKNFKEIVAIEGTEAEPTKYTLTYQVDGETYEKYELEEGAEITALEEPTKEGYTFSGWDNVPETMPAEDVIIKGTFTQNAAKEEEKETENTDVDEITIKDIGKTTWCSEYDLDFTNVAGIKAYTATGYDNKSKTIWLTRVMTVPAGTGILVKGEAGTYKIPHSTEDAYYTNMFKGNTGDPIKIEETEGDMTNYYLSGKDGSFVSVNGSANIGKNKAYLQLPTKFFAGTRSIGVTYDDEGTTGIWAIEQGTVNSERDVWFNLQGQRVDKPRKGLYIRNGKKVVVR